MKIEFDSIDIKKRKADSRGRISIGSEYSDREVTVVVLTKKAGEKNE